jgi:16S rRNA (cytosine1402-N4)-methyltransferase
MSKTPPQQLHQPVLLTNVVELLAPGMGESYLDLTAGYGGHASAIIQRTGAPERAVLVDRDQNAINELGSLEATGARLIHDDFAHAAASLADTGQRFDMVLLDVGVSSPQLDRVERGFSFQADGPLDMRMDQRSGRTAADIVNRSSRDELVDILVRYGEEPLGQARRIVQAIVNRRPITTTAQLAETILSTHRGRWQKTHPATRTFQALRIAVNDELGQLQRTLELIPRLLNDEGRVAIISFHSLEDRLVKRYFAEAAEAGYEAELRLLTKKPIAGSDADVHNPRARSAKLRAAVKIKKKGA